ncbi:MAG: putative Universal stress protein UspA-like nucleotide-binding protein [Rhodospirillales bacterium]|nr:putative Universal stress protein UspA-like nucleotide-binding protein [Rhodospirillales bacterium]
MLKDILVHVDGGPAAARRVEAAAVLAEAGEGHLVGLHVTSGAEDLPWIEGYATEMVIRYATERAEAERIRARDAFDRQIAGRAITHEWREATGLADRAVALHGRTADLIVLGQSEPATATFGPAPAVAEHVPLSAGRPCLVLPYAGHWPTLGRRVLVAWDGGREAARAVHDALPLLHRAEQVTIVTIGDRLQGGGTAAQGAAALGAHLTRHGLAVEVRHDGGGSIGVPDLLLSLASDLSADLMVMGAYGHNRLRDLIMGGVTRAILDHMTLPVLMSH